MEMSDVDNAFGKVIGGVFGNADARGRTAPGGSEILDAGQLLIAGMRLTTGWGRPDPGEAFGHGAAGFTGAGQTVDTAYPRDEWAGSGSQAYASANRRQSGSAATLALLDRDVQTVIAREAFQVDSHRGTLDDQSDHLSALGYATWSLALVPGVGKALKAAVEMTAVNTALLVCSTELATLASETGENAAELRRLADGYSALTRKSAPPALDDELPTPTDDDEHDEERRPDTEPTPDVRPGRVPVAAPTAGEPSVVAPPAPAPAAVPPPMPCAAAAEAPTATQAVPPPAASADPMAGMSSVFGAVGGAIGSVVAPLAAALTGVVTAAGQALSTATSAQPADSADRTPEPATSSTDEDPDHEPVEPRDDDVAEPALPDAVAAPGTPATPPLPVAEPPRAPAPAATRPPQ